MRFLRSGGAVRVRDRQQRVRRLTAELLEDRCVLAGNLVGEFGRADAADPLKKLTLVDGDGTSAAFNITGLGIGKVYQNSSGYELQLTGTTAATRVTIDAKGGDGHFDFRLINVDAVLNAFTAKQSDVTGTVNFAAGAQSITLRDVLRGALTIGASTGLAAANLSLQHVVDSNIQSTTAIGTLSMLDALDTDAVRNKIQAPSIASLVVGGSKARALPGNFEFDLKLVGDRAKPPIVNGAKFQVAGEVDGTWDFTAGNVDSIRSLTFGSVAATFSANLGTAVGSISVNGNASGSIKAADVGRFSAAGDVTNFQLTSGRGLAKAAVASNAPNSMASFSVKGAMNKSLVQVGLNPVDEVLNNGDDWIDRRSKIKSFSVGKQMSADSLAAAGIVPTKARVDGKSVTTAGDARFVQTAPLIERSNLTVEVDRFVVNVAEEFVFHAEWIGVAAPTSVKLYESDSNQVRGAFLCDLYDDGSALHRDAVAGDGIFSNVLAYEKSAVGDYYFTAEASGVEKLFDRVTAVAAPTTQELQASLDLQDTLQGIFDAAIAKRQTSAQALEKVATYLEAHPEAALRGSIQRLSNAVAWTSPIGIAETFFDPATFAGQNGSKSLETLETTVTDSIIYSTDAASGDVCGEALVVSPYFSFFESHGGDESNDIAAQLTTAGYDVTAEYNANVTISDFKGWGNYDTVVLSSHGAYVPGSGSVILSGVEATIGSVVSNLFDVVAGRIQIVAGTLALTPTFFSYYSGHFDDSIVYLSACESGRDATLANAFLGSGAAAVVGYTKVVNANFANARGQAMYSHLINDGTVGTIPQLNSVDPAAPHAVFKLFTNDNGAKLPQSCDELDDFDLFVQYSWRQNVRDLDTGTSFLGDTVGWSWNGAGTYLAWSGDDTSAGGDEIVTVNIAGSFHAGGWSGSTTVGLAAGWYSPAGGSGTALVQVGLKRKTTGAIENLQSKTISPGTQSSAAATVVGSVSIIVSGAHNHVEFTLS